MRQTVKKPFTMIELLVVITIITILASLLLPALSRARERAYSSSCASNLKQLAAADSYYVNDNNDYSAATQVFFNNGYYYYWVNWYVDHYLKSAKVTSCPAEKLAGKTMTHWPSGTISQGPSYTATTNYAKNVYLQTHHNSTWSQRIYIPVKVSHYKYQSQSFVAGDWYPSASYYEINRADPESNPTYGCIAFRHSGKYANGFYMDGHCASIDRRWSLQNDVRIGPSRGTAESKTFWYGSPKGTF